MRRSTPNCAVIAEQRDRLLRSLEDVDQHAIIRVLEGFATPERRARVLSVFDARLDSVTVVMDAPHDPHNGAAVLRSCDAFGLQRLHVIERSERFLSSRTVSRGSERWVEARTYGRSQDAIDALTASGHELVATHPEGELVPDNLKTVPRLALVLGNERDGIHEELMAACRRSVRIPMRGFAESLNVSVTAAILLQHATEGRPGDLSELERTKLYARTLILTVPRATEVLEANGITVEID
ncbi:MAG TPA: RNA methyltransferase [Polyangiaceae bacterium]|jgi:tRNA (guanosine-2'-O-)-methyltransferase|nr:RNA methyltransferase [Polyangiaceae bacterium]